MNFLSAKQVAQVWGISSQRVVQLARQGRIEGAFLHDRRWLVPENAERPLDSRTKAARDAADEGHYIYPYIIGCVHSEDQVNAFTPDEKALYELFLTYENGRLEECFIRSRRLLKNTESATVRIGVMYLLTLTTLYQSKFDLFRQYSVLFTSEITQMKKHREEYDYLLCSFNSETNALSDFAEDFKLSFPIRLSNDFLPCLSMGMANAELVKSGMNDMAPDPLPYELLCSYVERDGYWFSSMIMHAYLSLMYAFCNDEKTRLYHLRSAFDIAAGYNAYFSLASLMVYVPENVGALLDDYPAEVRSKVQSLMDLFVKARMEYAAYLKKGERLPELTKDDYTLIAYCRRDYSVLKMAEMFSLTESGIKKRLSALYNKLGVSNKRDMIDRYVDLIFNIGGDRRSAAGGEENPAAGDKAGK